MFFRMLKKDIAEKKALNIILLLFMCFASILTVCSAIVLLSNTLSLKETKKKVNATEVNDVQETLKAWYNDNKVKLRKDYYSGSYKVLPNW